MQQWEKNTELQSQFERMQRIYVFDKRNNRSFDTVGDQLRSLNDVLLNLDEGLVLHHKEYQSIEIVTLDQLNQEK